MTKPLDWNRMLNRIASLPIFRSHFSWGPINSLLLLSGLALTTSLLHLAGNLPREAAIAAGLVAVFLVVVMQLGSRWDRALAANLVVAIALAVSLPDYTALGPLVLGATLSTILAAMIQVASHWDKAVVLRLGRFRGLRGPGPFVVIPFIDRIESFIDQRVRATDFRAERILTLDTVPVYVDAICFWLVWNPERSVLEVVHYADAVILSAQTALKDAVGKHELTDLLSDRHKLGEQIQQVLDEKTNPWGITIQSVEITDVVIPEALEEAMSRRAQAERERQARIILATAESEIAEKFAEAAARYGGDSTAVHLRAMNMIYEGIRQRGSMVIVPSSALDSMGLGSMSGLLALAKGDASTSFEAQSPSPDSVQDMRPGDSAGPSPAGSGVPPSTNDPER